MKFKKAGVLVSAIASTAVCASLIAGSTFALFSDKKEVNIAVTSGKVAVEASVTVESTKSFDVVQTEGKWANGGFAKVDGATVNLVNITPGDEVTLKVTANNKSSVSAKYRCTYNVLDGYLLASGLDVSFGSVQLEDEGGKYQSYTTAWDTLGKVSSEVSVTISLPSHEGEVDNLYQGLSANIALTVEAVQANGVAGNGEAEHTYLPDCSELVEAAENGKVSVVDKDESLDEALASAAEGSYVVLSGDMQLTKVPATMKNVVVDANGYKVTIIDTKNGVFDMNGENNTYKNAVFAKGEKTWCAWSNTTVNYINCVFIDCSPYVAGHPNMVIDGCTFYETLQFCFDEGVNDRIHVLPDNLVITNNTFIVNNTDANAHGVVFNGGEKEEWEVVQNVAHNKKIVFENNTFVPVYEEKSYVAYYILTSNGTLTGKVRTFNNNTYNGLAKYSVNTIDNQFNLVSATEKLDLKNADEAMSILCPDCYNGNVSVPHAQHSIHEMLEIDENGVASVKAPGAWLCGSYTDWTERHVIAYDLDVSEFSEGDLIRMDFGENSAWQSCVFGIQKTADGYVIGRGADVNLANTKALSDKGAYAVKCVAYVNESGEFVREVLIDDVSMYQEKAVCTPGNLYWDVYGYSGTGYAKISNLVSD